MTTPADPVVSVIVPARNEEACLGACLESLITQQGIGFEIIVVDDASTDRTAEIARSFADRLRKHHLGDTSHVEAGLQTHSDPARFSTNKNTPNPRLTVISAPPLLEGWTGKNNAMSAGAKIAKGKWLLFTDADTVHKPGSLARAVAEAEQHQAALLSYSPEQEVRTFWEKAVMPVIFAELAATYPPKRVSDPACPIAAANGQYLMISREVYDAVGGHTKIAGDLLEDVAMARLVKSSGRKSLFRYGGDAVRTRMYRSWPQMKEGWTKNLALLFPKPMKLAESRLWEFLILLFLPPSLLRGVYWKDFPQNPSPAFIHWVHYGFAVFVHIVFVWYVVAYVIRMRNSHTGWPNVALGLLGLPIFAYLLLRSHRAHQKARFDWKDRTYVYTQEELEKLTAAQSVLETSVWSKLTAWISGPRQT